MCIGLGAIGAALGEGFTAGVANEALAQKPDKSGDILKNMLVGKAVSQSTAIYAMVISLVLIFVG